MYATLGVPLAAIAVITAEVSSVKVAPAAIGKPVPVAAAIPLLIVITMLASMFLTVTRRLPGRAATMVDEAVVSAACAIFRFRDRTSDI
jgi:hypothetical protein